MANKLQLYYPYKPFLIGQYFGESNVCVPANGVFPASKRKPVVGKQNGVCPAGYEELYPLLGDGFGHFMKGHTGMDLYGPRGTQAVRSPINGTVIEICTELERGLGVGIVTDEVFDMNEITALAKVRVWHLMSIGDNIRVGTKVSVGDVIGFPDSTGVSSGDHIHFEVKPVKHISQGNEDITYENILQDNGFFGAINPEPFFIGKYAIDEYSNILVKIIEVYKKILLLLKG